MQYKHRNVAAWPEWNDTPGWEACPAVCSAASTRYSASLVSSVCFLQNFLSVSLHKLHTKYLLCEMPAGFTSECSHLSRSSHTFLQPLTLLLAPLLFSVPSWHFSLSFDCCCAPWTVNNSRVLEGLTCGAAVRFWQRGFSFLGAPQQFVPK